MQLETFLDKLANQPDEIEFANTMAVIEALYAFTPTAFQNGDTHNEANQNNGSCKLFAFAKLHELNEQQTLACFGEYYRDVTGNPDGDDHQNIRNFIKSGWPGIQFDAMPLSPINS